jgi:hypothetical protein
MAWMGLALGLLLFVWGGAGMTWLAGRRALAGRRPLLSFVAGGIAWSILLLIPVAGAFVLGALLILALGVSLSGGLGANPDWFWRAVLRRGRAHAEQRGLE